MSGNLVMKKINNKVVLSRDVKDAESKNTRYSGGDGIRMIEGGQS